MGALFGVAGEAVEVALFVGAVLGAVEALEEAAVEEGDVGEVGERGVQGVEVGDGLLLRVDESGQRERGEDVEVAAVGLDEGDVPDEGGFFEDVLAVVDLVPAAVDDGDGEAVAVLEDHHDGHGEEAIDLAGDAGEFSAGVFGALQLDGDEDVGFEQAALNGVVGEEAGFAAEFLVGELEEEVGSLPLGDEGFGRIECVPGGEVSEEVLRLGACADEELVALVAELGEELAGGVLEREGLEIGESCLDGSGHVYRNSLSSRFSSVTNSVSVGRWSL